MTTLKLWQKNISQFAEADMTNLTGSGATLANRFEYFVRQKAFQKAFKADELL
jgi:hypothetical protein